MVESILKGLKSMLELQGPLQASIWDQGDAVGAWVGDKLVAVVFPTPVTLPQVCTLPLHCFAVVCHIVLLSNRSGELLLLLLLLSSSLMGL